MTCHYERHMLPASTYWLLLHVLACSKVKVDPLTKPAFIVALCISCTVSSFCFLLLKVMMYSNCWKIGCLDYFVQGEFKREGAKTLQNNCVGTISVIRPNFFSVVPCVLLCWHLSLLSSFLMRLLYILCCLIKALSSARFLL